LVEGQAKIGNGPHCSAPYGSKSIPPNNVVNNYRDFLTDWKQLEEFMKYFEN
jgi:hypothetical protein